MVELNEETTPKTIIEDLNKMGFKFTQDWFTKNLVLIDPLIQKFQPTKILEVGAFEGLSTTFFIDRCSAFGEVEIYSIDTWEGGVEHTGMDFNKIEEAYDHNIRLAAEVMGKNAVSVKKCKGRSLIELAKMVAVNIPKFDLIYVDGSHLAADVLVDAILSFNLLKVGGIMIFDDYNSPNPITPEFPKLGIESFLSTYVDKVEKFQFVIGENGENLETGGRVLYQLYLRKVKD